DVAGSDTGDAVATAADNQSDGDAPPDPEEDVLGWENGVWHNESIDVTSSDGYDRTEIERIVSRSMARVERVRGLEFDETPGVRLISVETYRQHRQRTVREAFNTSNVSTRDRLHQNTKFEALFLVGEDESYYGQRIADAGASAGARYFVEDTPGLGVSAGDIAVFVPEQGGPSLDEAVLGHELGHHLQAENFGLERFANGSTEEAVNTNVSLYEGGATWVGQSYSQRCDVEWDCLPTGESAPRSFTNFGLVLYGFGPYSNTATLFEQAREEGGVEAMNALYENPPESTEQFLHPDEYPDDEPVDVSYEDRSGDAWEMQTFEDGVDYATFGEAGVFTMLYYPSYDTRSTVAIDFNHPFDGAQGNTYVRLDFVHPASTGWDGDKLFVYTNASSAETNETGYVWKTVWESPDEATEFADAYTTILREYGGAVADRQGTYLVSDGSPFEDAFYVEVSGDTVTIVNAPTVGALAEVRQGAAPRAETTETTTDDGETTTDDTETATTTATSTPGEDGTDDGDGQAQPGFGVGLAVVALLAAVFLLRRRD
ncbi:hypothetical protein BRD18_06060, partial [Halobacteriales archaeon SW_7_71_33]